jgi:hypothetical protein
MTKKEFILTLLGIGLGIMLSSIITIMYVSNLHHVACKMYLTVEDPYRFDYVNKQFKCKQENSK